MKANYKNCYEIANKLFGSNYSEKALVRVAEESEELCYKLWCNDMLSDAEDNDGPEIDEKNLKAIVRTFGHTYKVAVRDTVEAMQEAAAKLI